MGSRERSRKAATARGGGGGDTAFLPTRPLSPDDARLPRAFPQPQAAGASRARRPSLSPARPVRLRPSLRLPHVCPEPQCPVFFLLCGPPGAPGLALLPQAWLRLACPGWLSLSSSTPIRFDLSPVVKQKAWVCLWVNQGTQRTLLLLPPGLGEWHIAAQLPRASWGRPKPVSAIWSMGQHVALCCAEDLTQVTRRRKGVCSVRTGVKRFGSRASWSPLEDSVGRCCPSCFPGEGPRNKGGRCPQSAARSAAGVRATSEAERRFSSREDNRLPV